MLHLLRQVLFDMRKSRHLAVEIFRREIARKYRNSVFGVILAFVPALVIAAWATLVQHAGVITLSDPKLPYEPFVLISFMLWTTFVDSIAGPIHALKSEIGTIARSTCPGEVVILSQLLEILFHFAVRFILIAAAMAWFRISPTYMAMAAPFALLLLIFFGLGIGLILAPLNVFYHDIEVSLGAVTTFWLFLTPVIIAVPKTGWASVIVRLNPVTPLLQTTRELLTLGEVTSPFGFTVMAVLSIALFLFGCVFYRASLPIIVDRANV